MVVNDVVFHAWPMICWWLMANDVVEWWVIGGQMMVNDALMASSFSHRSLLWATCSGWLVSCPIPKYAVQAITPGITFGKRKLLILLIRVSSSFGDVHVSRGFTSSFFVYKHIHDLNVRNCAENGWRFQDIWWWNAGIKTASRLANSARVSCGKETMVHGEWWRSMLANYSWSHQLTNSHVILGDSPLLTISLTTKNH